MARSDNIKDLNIKQIEWRNDCLVFFFAKGKRNQEGEGCDTPWHVYSNPNDPYLCPVLSLSKYIFSNPDIITSGGRLFPGDEQYSRFIKIFRDIIKENITEFKKVGVNIGDLGAHSSRKGAISIVSSGCTVSPPMASICLRAQWSMGNVKDRYIHYEKAGDQFTGRSVTGISSVTKELAISPVYWDYTDCGEEGKNYVLQTITDLVVNADDIEPPMFELLQYLFASLCYHYNFLRENICATNKLNASPLYNCIDSFEFLNAARVTFPWDITNYKPHFIGIPPHIIILSDFEKLQIHFK